MKRAERVVWVACFLLYVVAVGAIVYPAWMKARATEPAAVQKGN